MVYPKFPKIPRLSRDCTITEKLDGSNSSLFIFNGIDLCIFLDEISSDLSMKEFVDKYCLYKKDELYVFAGSKNRFLDTTSNGDNFGFAKWVQENACDLVMLGLGRHSGEWYGKGMQRGYGLEEKRFALFNVKKWHQFRQKPRLISIDPKTNEEKWTKEAPKCCHVVPILYEGKFDTNEIELVLHLLKTEGSKAVSGWKTPEGIVIRHSASGHMYKKTIENDSTPKGSNE